MIPSGYSTLSGNYLDSFVPWNIPAGGGGYYDIVVCFCDPNEGGNSLYHSPSIVAVQFDETTSTYIATRFADSVQFTLPSGTSTDAPDLVLNFTLGTVFVNSDADGNATFVELASQGQEGRGNFAKAIATPIGSDQRIPLTVGWQPNFNIVSESSTIDSNAPRFAGNVIMVTNGDYGTDPNFNYQFLLCPQIGEPQPYFLGIDFPQDINPSKTQVNPWVMISKSPTSEAVYGGAGDKLAESP
jgi:hypothetical protein